MAQNIMSNHTDMQDKSCGDCYDTHPIQSNYTRTHARAGAAEGRATAAGLLCILALNRVNIVAVTTILDLHVGVIVHHVPRH